MMSGDEVVQIESNANNESSENAKKSESSFDENNQIKYSLSRSGSMNVDSSNLSNFIKIKRFREDEIFGPKQRRETFRRSKALDSKSPFSSFPSNDSEEVFEENSNRKESVISFGPTKGKYLPT